MPKKQKKKKKTLLEFPDHIYSELTDIAFPSFQALINSLLKGKKKKKKKDCILRPSEFQQI